MASLFDTLFGPLGEEYCNIILVFTMITFAGLVLAALEVLYEIIMSKNKVLSIFKGIKSIAVMFFLYILYRLNYSVCKAAL
jgi:hypothetical protein